MKHSVIFLIESDFLDRELLSMTIEKFTQNKVFSFFSFDEALLYADLKPRMIIHDNKKLLDLSLFGESIEEYIVTGNNIDILQNDPSDIALDLALEVKEHLQSKEMTL